VAFLRGKFAKLKNFVMFVSLCVFVRFIWTYLFEEGYEGILSKIIRFKILLVAVKVQLGLLPP